MTRLFFHIHAGSVHTMLALGITLNASCFLYFDFTFRGTSQLRSFLSFLASWFLSSAAPTSEPLLPASRVNSTATPASGRPEANGAALYPTRLLLQLERTDTKRKYKISLLANCNCPVAGIRFASFAIFPVFSLTLGFAVML